MNHSHQSGVYGLGSMKPAQSAAVEPCRLYALLLDETTMAHAALVHLSVIAAAMRQCNYSESMPARSKLDSKQACKHATSDPHSLWCMNATATGRSATIVSATGRSAVGRHESPHTMLHIPQETVQGRYR